MTHESQNAFCRFFWSKIPHLQPGCVVRNPPFDPAKRCGLHLHGFPCLCAVPGPKWGSASAKELGGMEVDGVLWAFFFGRSLCQLGKNCENFCLFFL